MSIEITRIRPTDPAAEAIIRAHNDHCNAIGPAESCHNLTPAELDIPEITLWGACVDGETVGIGALKEIASDAGEVKSMHTLARARGSGAGRALVDAIVTEARARNYASLWLETGTAAEFTPARQLYESFGFVECPPFGTYVLDPHSVFYTMALSAKEPVQ